MPPRKTAVPTRPSPEAMMLSDLLPAYEQHCTDTRSAATARLYLATASRFVRLAMPGKPVAELTEAVLRRYLLEYQQSHAPNSHAATVCALRHFARWLHAEAWLIADICGDIKTPKRARRRREYMPDTEIEQYFHACGRFRDDRRAALAKAVLSILTYTGLRRAELLSLRTVNLDLPRKRLINVLCKGAKYRTLPLHDKCVMALREWLAARPEAKHDFLFCGKGGLRLGTDGLYGLLDEIRTLADRKGEQKRRPHDFRHSFGSRIYRKTGNLELAREALGHDNIATTGIYLHNTEEEIERIGEYAGLESDVPKPVKGQERPQEKRRRVSVRR